MFIFSFTGKSPISWKYFLKEMYLYNFIFAIQRFKTKHVLVIDAFELWYRFFKVTAEQRKHD